MKIIAFSAVTLALFSACAVSTEPDEPSRSSGSTSARGGGAHGGQAGSAATAGAAPASGGAGGQKGSTAGSGGRASAAGEANAAGGEPPNGGALGSAGTSSGANSGGTAGSGGAASACSAPLVATGSAPLIDDFEHLGRAVPANEGRSGVWDVWTKSAGAAMFPLSANYQTTGADMGAGYTHWTGDGIGGADDWGPTLTVQLAGGCPYDASVYSGISLKLKGSAAKLSGAVSQPVALKVMFWQPQAVPAQDASGGACTATACYNHFSTFVNVPSSWDAAVRVPFASLTQGMWTGTVPFAWNPKQLLAIQFQVEVDGSKGELATFDLSIDDLTFVP